VVVIACCSSLLGLVFGLCFGFWLVFVCCWVVEGLVVVHFYVGLHVVGCGVMLVCWGCGMEKIFEVIDGFETK
jgi:hypothetical protein